MLQNEQYFSVGDDMRIYSMEPIMQYCLYKCMHPKCVFGTNDAMAMHEHMNEHITLMSFIQSKDTLSNEKRQYHSKFRECCYCHMKLGTNKELIEHVQRIHSWSIYQCSHCFYRTIERDNIVTHYRSHHPGTSTVRLCSHLGDKLAFQLTNQYQEEIETLHFPNMPQLKCAAGKFRNIPFAHFFEFCLLHLPIFF